MRNPNSAGVVSRPRRALGVAAVAGLAGLGLAQVAAAAEIDAAAPVATAPAADSTEVSTVKIDAKRVADPSSSKFTAPLVDTPKSVTVIPSRIIEQTAATSLTDILRTSPGITFGAGEGGQPLADRPFIRGQSSANNIFVDGVRDTGGQTREIFNLEQVEVVKGPDSAYGGRGSGGGSVNLSSKSPKADTFARGSVGVGTDEYVRATADLNYAFNDNVAVRLNILGTQGDTPGRKNVDFSRWGVAPSLAVGLNGDTQLTVSYYHLDTDQTPDYGIPLTTKTTEPRTASGILAVDRRSFYGIESRDYQKTKSDIATFAIDHKINDDLNVRQVVRYSKSLNDYIVTNPGDGGAAQFVQGQWWMKRGTKTRWNPTETVAAVTDLHGKTMFGGLEHSFDVGVELSREENLNAAYSTFTTSGAACPTGFTIAAATLTSLGAGDCTRVYAPNDKDAWTGVINRAPAARNVAKTAAIYGFDTIKFGDKWLLNLGLRHDSYDSDGVDVATTQANGVFTSVTYTPRNGSWDFTNYQAGLVYKPTASSSLYVSYATSSTPPGISGGDQNSNTSTGTGNLSTVQLEPEDSESFEAGAKANVFHDTLALSAAVFQTTRKNAQIQIDANTYAQVGEVEVKGFELGFSGNVTPKWQVFGGYTYMDSELVRGAYTNVNQGDPLANTPKHSFSSFTTYRVTRKISLGGGAYYVSKSFGGNQGGAGGGANKIYAPSYTRFDAFASWAVSDKVDLQLNVQNLTDERYIARTNGVHHADPAPGRQAILTFNVKY
ncbi:MULTISPECIES: TonB-dependent siderophore receptor [unclassified Caulobacter]|uniref:TonB-dependent receptor n=1 Tax=unclassified Caulobacter TaxID=2648921 RepID=UPI0006FA3F56|nr:MULTISPECIES: TonB-dependent siderophore receptor [unclassified Caulobacter]KQV62238.1 TonB-dependent receptor [Caulobacter sp. Root342]KQV63158.1 TonB-dependent receptor [Caulobacter sp. Root343]